MTAERDPGLEQTAMSLDGRTPAPADALALAETRAPPPVALDRTLTPLPAELERTRTPLPEDLARTMTPLPAALARTHTPTLMNGASTLGASTRADEGEGRPALPRPVGDEDLRVKELVKARLFRSKARPVTIGRYTVLDRLGEGGMGIVYTAYDDQLDRKIAVKVLRGEATRQDEVGRTRLLREAQAMARLSHPNIVTVHEVDTLGDQVFIAMEFIRGVSLDAWLRGKPQDPAPTRSWRDVLAVFCSAGRGLEAAHRAGIVHRDFKPHNVLVGEDGAVKVLDFGLARAADHAGSEELAVTPESGAYNNSNLLEVPLTRTGAIMGTPAYMAPEQHLGQPASAQSDQFSFCVSLYEGLYGLHPFDCSTLAALITAVNAGKVKDPPPTVKVPGWLRHAVLRGLAVDAAKRYPSMTELLTVLAKDPAAQRRRWLASAGLAGFVGAAGFGAAAFTGEPTTCHGAAEELAQAWTGERAEAVQKAMLATGVPYAADTWARVQPRFDAYAAEWVAMRTEACETHRAAKQSDALFDLRTACLDQRRASLAALTDTLMMADAAMIDRAVIATAALPPLATCTDTDALTRSVAPPEDPAVASRVQDEREALARAKSLEDAGRYADAITLADAALAVAGELKYAPLAAESLLRTGSAQLQDRQFAQAETSLGEAVWRGLAVDHDEVAAVAASKWLFVQAEYTRTPTDALREIRMAEALAERVRDVPAAHGEVLNNLGVVYLDAGQYDRSRTTLEAALEVKRQTYGAEDPELVSTLNNLGLLAKGVNDAATAAARLHEASTIARNALGSVHPFTLVIQASLGDSYLELGRLRDASESSRRAYDQLTGIRGGDTPDTWQFLIVVGLVSLAQRDLDSADAAFTRILMAKDQTAMLKIPSHMGLAGVAARRDALSMVQLHAGQAVELCAATYGAEHPQTAVAKQKAADVLVRVGLADDALPMLEQSREVFTKVGAAEMVPMADVLETLGMAYHGLGREGEAEAELRRAVAIREAAAPADPALAGNLHHLGEVLLATGRAADAVPLLRRAVAIYGEISDADLPDLALTRFTLARALRDGGAPAAEAGAVAEQALAVLRGRGEGFAREVAAIEAWLKGQAA